MASVSLDRILAEATQKHLEMFQEEIRALLEAAWEEGHSAYKQDCSANPYLKEH